MRTANWIFGVLVVTALTFAGCGKSEKPLPGVKVEAIDATKFRPAFASASPETKAIVDNVMMSIQASLYKDALAGLEKLATTPNLTDQQKAVVTDLTEQLKKKMAAQTPSPGP